LTQQPDDLDEEDFDDGVDASDGDDVVLLPVEAAQQPTQLAIVPKSPKPKTINVDIALEAMGAISKELRSRRAELTLTALRKLEQDIVLVRYEVVNILDVIDDEREVRKRAAKQAPKPETVN
jgi:hypothetical protein